MDRRDYSIAIFTLAKLVALIAVVIEVVLIINANFGFLPEAVINVVNIIMNYVGFALLALVAVSSAVTKPKALFIVIILLVAIITINQFFPALIEKGVALIKK